MIGQMQATADDSRGERTSSQKAQHYKVFEIN
jgi:hypothetical protein